MLCRAKIWRSRLVHAVVALLCVAGMVQTVFAQDTVPAPQVNRTAAKSPNATVNLVNLLVKQGVLTEEQAASLIKQAEDEAYVAREATKNASTKAQEAEKSANSAAAAVSPPGTKRVTYVPEIVKRDLRNEIRKEVLEQAKNENWASPNTFPSWVSHIRLYGDIRVRGEGQFFPKGNINNGTMINYNAINTGSPFDVSAVTNSSLPPLRDVDTNRNRFRLRARLGIEADLFDGFSAGLRIATGDSNNPVSTNQTLGGGGGNFSKYPIWLDRGWLRYEMWNQLVVSLGRFDNPFLAPTDLMWYDDLGFDGVALQARHEISPGFVPFVVAGAFPLYNTALNYPNNGNLFSNPSAPGSNQSSTDKYLFAAQGGFLWDADPNVNFKFGAGYFDFNNVDGRFSDPCNVFTTADVCSTDLRRPSFAQYGNTYMGLRNIIPQLPAGPQFQYFGLATPFRVLELTGAVDLKFFDPVHIIIDGDYVNNLAFNKNNVSQVAVNNLGASPDPANRVAGAFAGGNQGAMGRLTVGYPKISNLWEWNAYVAYKYLESDAVVDAFTDPDFGLGGTNLKGYIVGSRLGLGQNVWASLKWMSANSIAGAPFAVDVLQLDLTGKF